MTRTKPTPIKKRPPAHKRIPARHGLFTRSARSLYDLIYSFGLGGCWMSNLTIARKLGYCKLTIIRARQQLVKRQVIVTARTNPHTWIMWARYHRAVQNCQVLLYPIRHKMDNPWYVLTPKSVGVTKRSPWGNKMLPKLDVNSLTGIDRGSLKKEAAKQQAATPSSQDSVPNPASPTGLTGNRLLNGSANDNSAGQKSGFPQDPPRPPGSSPDLDDFGIILFKGFFDTFSALGYPPERAANLANIRALEKRKGLKK